LGNADSLELKVSIVGYENKSLIIANKKQVLKIILGEQAIKLPSVLIKQNPIIENGDTTKYFVKNFTNRQDRVIGDVLAKLPGIEIDEATGAIQFNGKSISHYYIDGVDLLGSRYNIANRNIPADMVDEIQILANHQDVKLLDSSKISRETDLNIKLNKSAKNKLIGTVKTGVGITPLLWDNAITGLQFNKSFQFIASYKNNNAGSVLGNEISENVSVQKVGESKKQNIKENILSELITQKPPIAAERFLFNNTHLFHFNILKGLPNKAQLKFYASYLNDHTRNTNSSSSTYILPNGQQINFMENRRGVTNTNKVNGNLTYLVNSKKFYLKNITEAKLDFTKETGTITNPSKVSETLENPFFDYTNNFIMHLHLRKKIISFTSKTAYNKMPQKLDVVPGQFNEVFNDSIPYQRLLQKTILSNFNTDNSISFFSKIGKINEEIKLGTEYIHKNIQSNILKQYNDTLYQLTDSFKNNINWNNVRIYTENETTIGKGETQLDIRLPLELNILKTNNLAQNYNQSSSHVFFNPIIDFSFPLLNHLSGDIVYSLEHGIGSIIQIIPGYILTSYKNLTRNDSLLPLQMQQNASFNLYYKNSPKSIFSNINISASDIKKNIIYNQLFDGFFIQSVGRFMTNHQKNFTISGNTSKFFTESKINIALNYNYSLFTADLLEQNLPAISNSNTISLGLTANFNMLSFASLETKADFDYFKNVLKQSNFKSPPTSANHLHLLAKFYFYLSKKSTLNFNNNYYKVSDNKNNKRNNFFEDIGFKQKFKKTDLEIVWSNITNIKTYYTIHNLDNLREINRYNIRPTSLMLKYYFNF
jgi:hypothetical protein